VIATEDGDWIQVANGIQLRTPGKAGKPADGPTLVIVESQGRSALLLQGESGLPTEFQQMLLLLKERAEALPPGMTKAAYIREKEQTWEDLASNVPKANGSASNSYVGQIVAFQGTRASYGSEYLLVSAKSRSGVVRCQMRTDIDGARNAELWVAAMVGVYVEGRVLSINPSTKIVEIEPISANVVWAR
jgi:hypothetical protein